MKLFKRSRKTDSDLIPEHNLTKIYTDNNENEWFEFADIMSIPAKRAIAAEVATRFADMNLTKPILKELIEKMKDHANKGNVVGLFNILAEIEFRLDFIGEEQTLLELASIYFILDGEDPSEPSETWKAKKRELMEEDSDAKSFFLSRVYLLTTKFSELSEADFQKYLKQNKAAADRINRYLSATMSADTLKT